MSLRSLDRLRAVLPGDEARAMIAQRPGRGGRPAAVLIALGERDGGWQVVLVEKRPDLRSHAGQIAFPGGSLEPGDPTPLAGALREADEEVGLPPAEVDVLGVLPPAHVRASDFDVTAVVGHWRSPRPLAPVDVTEIAAVHAVDVDVLLDPDNRVTWTHPAGFTGPGFLVGDLFVWGFTAHLLDGLFTLAGWTQPWDTAVQRDVPERFLRGRRR